MSDYVADTHAMFWYLTGSSRLGPGAKKAFDEGTRGTSMIYIPAIVLAELFFLNEKAGHPLDFPAEYRRLEQSGQFRLVPLLSSDVLDFEHDRTVTEMDDRIVVGVARRMQAVCISADRQITQSGLVTVVW